MQRSEYITIHRAALLKYRLDTLRIQKDFDAKVDDFLRDMSHNVNQILQRLGAVDIRHLGNRGGLDRQFVGRRPSVPEFEVCSPEADSGAEVLYERVGRPWS
jgi:hypothetical protein